VVQDDTDLDTHVCLVKDVSKKSTWILWNTSKILRVSTSNYT